MTKEDLEQPAPEEIFSNLISETLKLTNKRELEKRNMLIEILVFMHEVTQKSLDKDEKRYLEKLYTIFRAIGPDYFTAKEWNDWVEPVLLDPIDKRLFSSKDI